MRRSSCGGRAASWVLMPDSVMRRASMTPMAPPMLTPCT
jgi:hypothetical protein